MKNLLTPITIVSLILFNIGTVYAKDTKSYLLATASTGGTYYPVGVALATLTKLKLESKNNISISAISSAGSGENIKLIRDDEVQFGIINGLYGYYAATGTGPMEKTGPQKDLRSITMLWKNVEHFVVKKEHVKTGTITDFISLKGETVALGKKNSGALGANAALLNGFGVDVTTDFDLFYGGFGPSADAMRDGRIEGLSAGAGIPVSSVTQLSSSLGKKISLLSLTPEQVKIADAGKGIWTPTTIPAGTYPDQDKDVETISAPNFLATSADLSKADVYLITKTIYENLAFLNAIHPATKVMAIEKAIVGLPVPLHPGAVQFYQEKGIKIPSHLIVD